MKNTTQIFHTVSYLQYLFMAVSVYYYFPFIISLTKDQPDWDQLNFVLMHFGIALSFSTLQDTTKTQNKFSKKIWEDPRKGKAMLIYIAILAMLLMLVGIGMLYLSTNDAIKNVSVGVIVLGIGVIGMLKSAIEMFENHRKDKN